MFDSVVKILASSVVILPALLLTCLAFIALFSPKIPTRILFGRTQPLPEKLISGLTLTLVTLALLAAIGVALIMWSTGTPELLLDVGDWIALDEAHFHFHVTFVFDLLSVPFLVLSLLLCAIVGTFASRYLHREPGFQRYFFLYSLFTLGMVVTCLAETVEVLFLGWELVGLSSALLVGFFHERQAPVVNGLRVWGVYRLADASFLIAAVVLHHMTGEGDWHAMSSEGVWPYAQTLLTTNQALGVGLLLLIAAAGKSALIPFSGWLPRAMEGPTASSAIFYGALSVHLGAYLLLRVSPMIAASPALSYIVIGLGLATAVYASLAERVQGDIKSALAFSSLAQVGLIVAEIGMGWVFIALFHLLGHAMLRTVQLLRAPSLLQDYFKLETALGQRIAHSQPPGLLFKFPRLATYIYRFALERGHFDSLLQNYIANPVVAFFRFCSRLETSWIAWCGNRLGGSISTKRETNGRLLTNSVVTTLNDKSEENKERTANA
jgi:NADH-quinone oxidoreductase subunit L